MGKTNRKFTQEDRLKILRAAEKDGQAATLRKHNIVPSLFGRWRKKLHSEGLVGLKSRHEHVNSQVRELEQENERYKRIIAKQALEIDVKSELLKKQQYAPGSG